MCRPLKLKASKKKFWSCSSRLLLHSLCMQYFVEDIKASCQKKIWNDCIEMKEEGDTIETSCLTLKIILFNRLDLLSKNINYILIPHLRLFFPCFLITPHEQRHERLSPGFEANAGPSSPSPEQLPPPQRQLDSHMHLRNIKRAQKNPNDPLHFWPLKEGQAQICISVLVLGGERAISMCNECVVCHSSPLVNNYQAEVSLFQDGNPTGSKSLTRL